MIRETWDEPARRWRYFRCEFNAATGRYEDVCETDAVGTPL
jgi:hypothetical protein